MTTWLTRQRYLIDFTLSSLGRRKTRTIGLGLVYTLLVFILSSVLLASHALRREAALLLQDSPDIIVQRLVAGRHDLLPASYLEPLRSLRGVTAVTGRLWGYYYDPVVKANYTLMAATQRGLVANAIVIGSGLARSRGFDRGDYFTLRAADGRPVVFQVVERLDSRSELLNADLILLSPDSYRALFGIPVGVYTDAAVTVRNPREVRTVAEKIVQLLPDSRPILREEVLRTYEAIFGWREGMVFIALGAVILAFVILAWDKASGLSAEERREIGILKAIGWETADVIAMKFWEGALISLTAFLSGYLLAYLHVFYGQAALFTPVLKGWAVLYPSFRLTPVIDGLQVTVLFAGTVLPYTFATLIPIWRAAIADPDTVMRL